MEFGPLQVNDRGDIFGSSETANGESHLFVYRNGLMTDVTTLLGASFNDIAQINPQTVALNDAGSLLVNLTREASWTNFAVLITPVPEPQVYALLLAGLMALWVVRRRRGFYTSPYPCATS